MREKESGGTFVNKSSPEPLQKTLMREKDIP
jgi:hypothetical protein